MVSTTLFFSFLAYLSGSVPWGVVFTGLFSTVDIRSEGSRNIGASNVLRLAGRKLALLTLAGDFLKSAIPVLAAFMCLDVSNWKGEVFVSVVALSAFAGHLFPVFLGFRGGKGVATAGGCFLVLSPMALLVSLLVYIVLFCWSGRSSAGSLGAVFVLPIAVWLDTASVPVLLCALIMGAVIYVRHMDNVRRLLKGIEPPFFPSGR